MDNDTQRADMMRQDRYDRHNRARALGAAYAEQQYDAGARAIEVPDQLDSACRVAGLTVCRDERSIHPQPQPADTLPGGVIPLRDLQYSFWEGYRGRMAELLDAPDFIA
jgi:hypothetical protein